MKKVKIIKAIDGDTMRDSRGNYYRLAGIDTPEKGSRNYGKAKEKLENKVEGEIVYLKEVGKSYGRSVVEARVKGEKSTINESMKRAGFGV